jgi:hypothetical protein
MVEASNTFNYSSIHPNKICGKNGVIDVHISGYENIVQISEKGFTTSLF